MRTFFIIWFGQTISHLGTRITGFALTLWIFEQTGQATSIALVGLAFGVTSILVNLFAGSIVDHFNRKRLIWLMDLLAGVVTIIYFILFITGNLAPWHIYLGSAIRGGFSAIQELAYVTSISLMVPKDQLVRTSSMQILAGYSGNIIGPGLGAALYYWIDVDGVMMIDMVTFTIAVLIILFNDIPQPQKISQQLVQSKRSLVKLLQHTGKRLLLDIQIGGRYILSRPGLRALLIVISFANFFDGPPNALLGAMILTKTGNNASALAIASIGSGIGGVISSFLIALWGGPKKRKITAVLLATIAAGLSKTGIGLSASPVGWSFFSGTASSTFPLRGSANQAIWLIQVDPEVQGRVLSIQALCHQFAFYLGFGLAPLLADYIFEPALMADGWLTPYISSSLFPAAAGSGFAFVLAISSFCMALVGILGFFSKNLAEAEPLL